MSLITKHEFNKLVKTDSFDISLFLLGVIKNIYNIVENKNDLSPSQKLIEISDIFTSICYPQIE